MISVCPWTVSRSVAGQSAIGRMASVAGAPSRSTPTRHRCWASTSALVKCVVPIITALMAEAGDSADFQDLGDGADDAAADIRRGRRLVAREHGAAAQQHRIGVRAAHVDANPQHFGHQAPATEVGADSLWIRRLPVNAGGE